MSVPELQACLARLYVDRTYRRLFDLAPDVAFADYRLADEERVALRQVDRRMLEYFAGIIATKRRRRLQNLYPATFALGAAELEPLFQRYHELQTTAPHRATWQEAQEFGYFMEESLAGYPDLPPHAAELVRFERLCQTFYHPKPMLDGSEDAGNTMALDRRPVMRRGVQVVSFRYDVVYIAAMLKRGVAPNQIDPNLGDHHIVFQSASAMPPVMSRVSSATNLLLSCCDGTRDVAAIVSAVEDKVGAKGLQNEIIATLRKLHALGLINIISKNGGS